MPAGAEPALFAGAEPALFLWKWPANSDKIDWLFVGLG
jgi:hypothetical protein